MLYLCLRFPYLGLEALPLPVREQACALTGEGKLSSTIVLCNTQAEAAGVRCGQSLSTALSLCAELRHQARQTDCETRHLHNLALWAYRFSGEVSLLAPNALLLELGHSLRLFHGLGPLYRGLMRAYRQRGLAVQAGLANTPLAAELLTYREDNIKSLLNEQGQLQQAKLKSELAKLPVNLLPLPASETEAMHNMGLRHIRDLLRLPQAELGQRFGKGLSILLDQLQGRRADPRPLFQPAEVFSSERQFDHGLQNSQQLRFPISALLRELETYLRLRQCVSRELHWQILYQNRERQDWILPLSQRHFEHRQVLQLVMLQLEQQPLRGEVENLRLLCRRFIPLPTADDDLFAGRYNRSAQREKLALVLDKLRLRLGENALYHLTLSNQHLPEYSGYALPLAARRANSSGDYPQPSGLRPSWLLSEPQVLQYHAEALYWQGKLQLLQGPERLDNAWWQQREVRDYYIARHEDGRLCWLYRDCLNLNWYLHGFFG